MEKARLKQFSTLVERLKNDAAYQSDKQTESEDKARFAFSGAMTSISSSFSTIAKNIAPQRKEKDRPEEHPLEDTKERIAERRWKKEVLAGVGEIKELLISSKSLLTELVIKTKSSMSHDEKWRREEIQAREMSELASTAVKGKRDNKGRFVSGREEERRKKAEEKSGGGSSIMQTLMTFIFGRLSAGGGTVGAAARIGIFALLGRGILKIAKSILLFPIKFPMAIFRKIGLGIFARAIGAVGFAAGPLGWIGITLLTTSLLGIWKYIKEGREKGMSGGALALYVTKQITATAWKMAKGLFIGLTTFIDNQTKDLQHWAFGLGRNEHTEQLKKQIKTSREKIDAYTKYAKESDQQIAKLRDDRERAIVRGDSAKIASIDAEIAALQQERDISLSSAKLIQEQTDKAKFEMQKEKSGWFIANLRWIGRGVTAFVSDISGWISGWFSDLQNWASRQLAWASEHVQIWKESITGAFQSVVDTVSNAFGTIKGAFTSLKERIMGYVKSWFGWASDAASAFEPAAPEGYGKNPTSIEGDLSKGKTSNFKEISERIDASHTSIVAKTSVKPELQRLNAAIQKLEGSRSSPTVIVNNTSVGGSTNVSNSTSHHGGVPSPYPVHQSVLSSGSFSNGM